MHSLTRGNIFHHLLVACAGLATLTAPGLAKSRAQDAARKIEVLKTPDGGIQPQAVIDAKGTIHLLYFRGEPSSGDLYYTHLEPDSRSFSQPIRVNSEPGTAVATGTIRGGQIALGREGR
ncbi:MAG: hypothetical protein IRY99_19975, partial [Isosphaeraceae bacterium]|nr:hypothetical protein [Isosphaeraceae bacterium]